MTRRLHASVAIAAVALSILAASPVVAQTSACGQFPLAASTWSLVRLYDETGNTTGPGPYYHSNNGMGYGGLAAGPDGDIYSASGAGTVRKGPSGTLFTTISGSPQAMAFDAAGNLLITEGQRGEIIKVTPAGVQSVLLTTNTVLTGIALDRVGNIYVADYSGNSVMAFRPNGAPLTAWGAGGVWTGPAQPMGLAFDADGNLYVTNENTREIVRVDPNGLTSSVYATLEGIGGGAVGLAFDGDGNLFVADMGEIYKITTALFTPGSTAPTPGISSFHSGSGTSLAFATLCNAPEAQPEAVPTLSEWAMILFALGLAGSAALWLERRRVPSL